MYVTVIHDISDPDQFWGRSDQLASMPEGLQVRSSYPNDDGTRAVCLWEGDSEQAVKDAVEGLVGDVSTNEYFGVNPQNAIGLPAAAPAAQ